MSEDRQAAGEYVLDRTDPDLLRPPSGSFEARASLVFRFLAFLEFGGVVLALFPPTNPVSLLQSSAFSLMSLALGVLYVAEWRGLDRRKPWAIAALRPLLLLAGAAGVGTVIVAATEGHARLPLEAVAVVWAWLRPRAIAPVPRLGTRSGPLALAAGALLALLLTARPLFGWGGAFDVHAQDLVPVLTVDCGAPGGGPPPSVRVTYDWSWRSTSPMPNGVDIVVLGWFGADASGRPLYVLDKLIASGTGVFPGLGGYPSLAMADQIGAETRGTFRWGIKLTEQRYRAGQIVAEFKRAVESPAAPEPLEVRASYVHLGIWRQDAAKVTCAW
jgi:hypothetical protein